ncbi:pectinacetylesterase family protein [Lysobacter sp. MMG2]|uniref:pectinacetylesterase family protein n=1 Tax=Lysobacter sp. MMG2 TaxID=2801338 RepID=UPI001C23F884|nr:pectinacetylesterase family protein [Lysobacter sp. MMG2]MBU8976201.1 pectinacetylesterase family protein [Lysobacter sp. MMG2]
MNRKPATLVLLFALAMPAAALAEEGDYAWWQVLVNLVSPPAADNKVTPAQRNAPTYPLLANPAGFDDAFAPGHYSGWQTVQLAPQTGAVCGNGTPYKFFVNRVADTRNTLIYMEGGGACWDYASCKGLTPRSARNPDGIPDDYMSLLNPGASLVSPFVLRISPTGDVVKTQKWNLVYVPYCTGDIYSGDRVAVYPDPNGGAPLVYHHNGLRNARAVVSWLKDHLPRPTQLVQAGCSAGGVGSMLNYEHMRGDLAPNRAFLINDSGPVFSAPNGASPAQYPSVPLFATIRPAWGLDATNGPIDYLAGRLGPGFSRNDYATLIPALANKRRSDRLGITYFWQDLNYSSYSYERFFPEIQNAPNQAAKEALLHQKWAVDTTRLKATTDSLSNVGGYFPQFRALNESHCDTIVDFKNGDVQERGLELSHFIDNVLNGQGAVLDASESSDQADRAKPFNPFYALIDALLN